jgi:hypothetical protein
VADGAVIWFVQMSVVRRAARFTYGICIGIPYNPLDHNHQGRSTYTDPAGVVRILGGWGQIVPRVRDRFHNAFPPVFKNHQGQVVDMTTATRQPFFYLYTTAMPGVQSLAEKVYAFIPGGSPPTMLMNTKSSFIVAYSLEVDSIPVSQMS